MTEHYVVRCCPCGMFVSQGTFEDLILTNSSCSGCGNNIFYSWPIKFVREIFAGQWYKPWTYFKTKWVER